jgi:hypothetical protein
MTSHWLPDGGREVGGPGGVTLRFTPQEWVAFLAGATDGEFRRPLRATV